MAHLNYDFNDFVSVRYYQGTYGCTGSTDRYIYYGMSGTPTLMFNGTLRIVGAGDAAATGSRDRSVGVREVRCLKKVSRHKTA